MFDPYEWIDPEKGRQRRVVFPAPHYPKTDAFKMTPLRERAIKTVVAYAKTVGRESARDILVNVGNAGINPRLSNVADEYLEAVIRACGPCS